MNKKILAIIISAIVLLSVNIVDIYTWGNGSGGDGFGTHDWVLKEAIDDLDGYGSWINLDLALKATDDPDTVFHDTYYHVYDIWGSTYGNAPYKIQYYYDLAVSYLAQGKNNEASQSIGWMSHYVSDLCNPMHTDSCDKETSSVHSGYESKVNTYTDVMDEAVYTVIDDGETYINDPTQFAKDLAVWSHYYYSKLVNEYYSKRWTSQCNSWTQTFLNKAGNALHDLIYSIEMNSL